MSTTPNPMPESQAQHADETTHPLHETVQDLVDRVEDLEEENRELEAENEKLRQRLDDLEDKHDYTRESLWELEDVVLGDVEPYQIDLDKESDLLTRIERATTHDDIQDLKDDVADARQRYHQQAAMLQKRFTALEDELDIDTMELATSDDQIARLVKNGPEDVDAIGRINKKERRARKMLIDAGDCGKRINDKQGQRVVFKSSKVKPYLKGEEGKSFNTTEVRRIFEVVHEIGKTTTRRVKLDKNEEDQHRLSVWGL